MKILNTLFIIILYFICRIAIAQDDVERTITEAKDYYGSGKLQDARFALQQTLQALDVVIGKEVLKILPKNLNNYDYIESQDYVSGGSGGITGLNVTRNYLDKTDSSKTLDISLINNSPLIGTINAFMTNPLFMNTSDGNQKTVRAAGYKAMLTKRTSDDVLTGYELQIPFGQSLMTFTCEGITKEPDMIALVEKVDIKSIVALVGAN